MTATVDIVLRYMRVGVTVSRSNGRRSDIKVEVAVKETRALNAQRSLESGSSQLLFVPQS
jgi:hypothetical protein